MHGWGGAGMMMNMRGGMGMGSLMMYGHQAPSFHPSQSDIHSHAPLDTFASSDIALEATAADWEAAFSTAHESRAATLELDSASVIDYTLETTQVRMDLTSPSVLSQSAASFPSQSHAHSGVSHPLLPESTIAEPSPLPQATALQHFESALRSQTLERDLTAIDSLLLALELDPSLGEAWFALGVSYANERRWEDAMGCWESWVNCLGKQNGGGGEKGAQVKGEWVSGRGDGLGIGEVEWYSITSGAFHSMDQPQAQQGRSYADIIAQWKSTRSAREKEQALAGGGIPPPTIEDRSNELINVLVEMAQARAAGEIDPEVQTGLGVLLNSAGEYVKASDCFAAALEVKPEDPLLFNRLGASLANQNKTELAIHYYSEALRVNPSFVRARYNLSMAEMTMERHQEAVSELLTCIMIQQDEPEPEAVVQDASVTVDATSPSHRLTTHALWHALASSFATIHRHDLANLAGAEDLPELMALLPA
ncbi:hypothetical protein BCR35DRAFT_281824, partial [Leucosporidium creatinivorum]